MIWLLSSTLALASPVQVWDFEDGPSGFTPSSGVHFEWGPLDDSASLHGWATNIDGNYLNDAHDTLVFPPIDLHATAMAMLVLEHWYSTESGALGDAGWLEAQVDGVWERLDPVYGYPFDTGFTGESGGWRTAVFDLSHLAPDANLQLVFQSGISVSYPGWWVDEVRLHDGDVAPPRISDVSMPADTDDVDGPYWVEATIIDDKATPSATLFWTVGDGEPLQVPMSTDGSDRFMAGIEGQDSGTVVEWWIEASDGLNTRRFPSLSDGEFQVELPAPTDLNGVGLDQTQRIASSHLTLRWEMPDSPYLIREFEVRRDGVKLLRTNHLEAEVPLAAGHQAFTVAARFDTARGAMPGEPSDPLFVQAALPEAIELSPNQGWPGEQLRIDLTGHNLYLSSDALLIGAPEVTPTDVTIIDTHHMRAVLTVDEQAMAGPRTLTILRLDGEEIPVPPFEVLSSDGMPRVHSAHPSTARQGAQTTVFLELGDHLLSTRHTPTVTMGDGVLVERIFARGSGLDVEIVVTPNAALGAHPIEVDDGTRVLTGASFTITDQMNRGTSGCTTGPRAEGGAMRWTLLFVAALWFRRRSTR